AVGRGDRRDGGAVLRGDTADGLPGAHDVGPGRGAGARRGAPGVAHRGGACGVRARPAGDGEALADVDEAGGGQVVGRGDGRDGGAVLLGRTRTGPPVRTAGG